MVPFPINRRFNYPQFSAYTAPDGIRVYHTPGGIPAPSVTTILGTLPKPGIDAWRKAVGKAHADFITKESTDIGSEMHDMLEGWVSDYLQGRPQRPAVTEKEKLAFKMYGAIRQYGLCDLDEVWGIEEALHCHHLYAGRCDLIGVYAGEPSIIDYKSSRKPKPEAWVKNYKLQIAAYAVAHQEMFGVDAITQGVILIGIRPDVRSGKVFQRFILDRDELEANKIEWMGIVEKFHQELYAA